jgi:hypothetical protein
LLWVPAFTEKSRPRYGAVRKEWEGALYFLEWLQQQLRANGRSKQRILFVSDGHYDNLGLWKGLPAGVTMIARTAKNRVLWHLPPKGARANRRYGERAQTPREYWRERDGWQALELLVRGRVRHLQVKVKGPFLRRGAPNRPLFLILVRGKKRKRYRRQPLPFLVNATWRDGQWQLPLPVKDLLLAAWQRWEIEVAHREMKANFGLGEKQNWNPRASVLSTQWSAWLYAVLLLATWRTWQLDQNTTVPTRWWRGSKRWSFNTMRRAYQMALWGNRPSSPLTLQPWLTWEDWPQILSSPPPDALQAALSAIRA